MDDKELINSCGCDTNDECGCADNDHGCGCGCDEHEHEKDHECGCGCGDHGALVVDLEDENGNTVACEVIDGFVYNEKEFALVQNPQDGSVYLFKVVGEGEEGELVVPDDEEFKGATAYYESMLENEE